MLKIINIDENFLKHVKKKRISSELSNSQMHIAITFVGNKFEVGSIMSFGINYPVNIHAEMNAIDNIPSAKSKKNMSILVLRVTKSGKLVMSKPCKHCVSSLYNKIYKFDNYRNDGFNKSFNFENKYNKIKYIYYSNENGLIVREKLKNMYKYDEKLVTSSGNRKWKILNATFH